MAQQNIKLSDLSESELSTINADIEAKGDKSIYSIDEEAQQVTVVDEADVEMREDPRKGVMDNAPPMSDSVAAILEEPFKQTESGPAPEPETAYKDERSVNERLAEESEQQEPPKAEEKPFEPDPSDVRNFVRSLLGNKRYTKSFSVYGGAVEFTLAARTHKQEGDCIAQSAGLPPLEALSMLSELRLAYSLVALRVGNKTYDLPRVEPGQVLKPEVSTDAAAESGDLFAAAQKAAETPGVLATEMRMSELGELEQVVVGHLTSKMREFDLLVTALQQRADDPKYWETDTAD